MLGRTLLKRSLCRKVDAFPTACFSPLVRQKNFYFKLVVIQPLESTLYATHLAIFASFPEFHEIHML